MRYPGGWNVGGQDSECDISRVDGTSADKIPDVRYPDKVERRPDRIPDVKYPEKVERRPDKIPTPGGMSYDSRPGGMSDATRRKGDVYMSKREKATWQVLGRIPQVGDFSADHHLGSGWLCKRFRAVMGGCITTKGKTTG